MNVAVLGSINSDFSFQVPAFPVPGETMLSLDMVSVPGGKGANQAIAATRMGAAVAMLGCVGDDARGAELLDHLRRQQVDVSGVARNASVPTGLATILVNPDGENLIVVAQGANATVDATVAARVPAGARCCLAQPETPIAAVAAFLAIGRERGSRCVLNAAPAVAEAATLFGLCDIIIVNEVELAFYAGREIDLSDDARDAGFGALELRDDQALVVTRGRRGVIALQGGRIVSLAAHRVEAIDTTGAGDCFCGALAAALARGMTLEHALAPANAAAALAVQERGAAAPDASAVDRLLHETSIDL